MCKAILKLGDTRELTLLNLTNEIIFTYSLTEQDYLTECYKYLNGLEIAELRVIVTPKVLSSLAEDHLPLSDFAIAQNVHKYTALNKHDLDKLQFLCSHLKIEILKIYDILDYYKTLGKDPIILCGPYIDGLYSYMYVDEMGIKDFRASSTLNPDIIDSMVRYHNVINIASYYNDIKLKLISQKVGNFSMLSEDQQLLLTHSLITLFLNEKYSFAVSNTRLDKFPEIDDHIQDLEPATEKSDDFLEEVKLDNKHTFAQPKDEKVVELLDEEPETKPRKNLLGLVLDIAGAITAVTIAFSVIANKQMPNDTSYLKDKQTELVQLVKPRQNTIKYYDTFLKSMADEENQDSKLITEIGAIKVDGLIAEVKLHKNEVGVVVYLKDPSKIDEVKVEMNKLFKIGDVNNSGTVTLDNTSLTKFIINGVVSL